MGDSFTFGSDADNKYFILDFTKEIKSENWEVINAGVPVMELIKWHTVFEIS